MTKDSFSVPGQVPAKPWLLVLFATLILIGFLAYATALGGALFFDDQPHLTLNTLVQIDGSSFDDWRAAALSSGAGPTRRPVSMLTFAFNHVLFGDFSPVHLKAINLLIHGMIGVLVYFLAGLVLSSPALDNARLGNQRLIALLAAAIWLLHPLHVSTVLYAIQRMAQLSTLFVVAGLLVFCRYRLRWAQHGADPGEVVAAALWLFMLLVLAVFSKENGALLPWLIIVLEVTLFRGVWQQRRRPWLIGCGWVALVAPLLCLAVLLLLSPETVTGRYLHREFTLEERLLSQGRILWHYLGWLLMPDINAMGFQHDDIPLSRNLLQPHTTWIALLAWLAVLAGAWRWRNTFPVLLFSLLFYLVAHAMESTVLPLEMVYEHRNYLPSVAVVIFFAVVLGIVINALPQLGFGVAASSILIILLMLLAIRAQTWSDATLLARVNVENHPRSPRSHFFYGHALFQRHERREELQLDEREALKLAMASRYYFEKMHEIDGRDFAPIVMLYQIDSVYFPDMPVKVDWLDKLSQLLLSRRLQASDYTSFLGLIDYFSHHPSSPDQIRFVAMIDTLIMRYPESAALLIFNYKLLSDAGQASPEALFGLLTRAEEISPGYLEIYPYKMIEKNKSADWAAIYEAAGGWMQQDPTRRQLPALRKVFNQ